tara:strand:+ start:350 stop:508 length:159 start_codon:yes stop_codon:yes gene_type:complete
MTDLQNEAILSRRINASITGDRIGVRICDAALKGDPTFIKEAMYLPPYTLKN